MSIRDKNYPIHVIKDEETRRLFEKMLEDIQDRQLTILSSEPSVNDIDNNEIKIYDAGSGTRYIYTKINGTLYRAALTAV